MIRETKKVKLLLGFLVVASLIFALFFGQSNITGRYVLQPEKGTFYLDYDLRLENDFYDFPADSIPAAIVINDSIELDCDGAIINGNRQGIGILVQSPGVVIRNCNIDNYEYGIYVNTTQDPTIIGGEITSTAIADVYSVNDLPREFSANNFDNALSTDFKRANLDEIEEFQLGRINKGKISFGNAMTKGGYGVQSEETIDLTTTNLDDAVIIEDNFISVDTKKYPELNIPSTLTFFNLPFDKTPVIIKNDQLCSDCDLLEYAYGVLVFSVDGFSNYTSSANSNLTTNDTTDNLTTFVNQSVTFWAIYTNYSGSILTTATQFNASCNLTFTNGTTVDMIYSSGRGFNYTTTFNTTGQSHVNISCNSSQYETINLTEHYTISAYGNITYDEFNNALTTDFSQYSEEQLANLTNVTIGILNLGLINFTNNYLNLTNLNLSDIINISANHIEIDISGAGIKLNKSADLTLFNLQFDKTPVILRDGAICFSPNCTSLSYSSNEFKFNVSHFTAYSSGANSNLTIYDENDPEGGSANRKTNQQIKFFANYTNRTSGAAITGATCNITFNDSSAQSMSYNSSLSIYEYNRSFTSIGEFTYTINCSQANFELLSTTDNVTVYSALTTPTLKTLPSIVDYSPITVIGYTDEVGVNLTLYALQGYETPYINYTSDLSNITLNATATVNTTNISSNEVIFNEPHTTLNAYVGYFINFPGHTRENLQFYNITAVVQSGVDNSMLTLSPNLEQSVSAGEIARIYNDSAFKGWFNLSLQLFNGSNQIFARSSELSGSDHADSSYQILYRDYQNPTIDTSQIPSSVIVYDPTLTVILQDDGEIDLSTLHLTIWNSTTNLSAHFSNSTALNISYFASIGYNTSVSNFSCSGNGTYQSCSVVPNLGNTDYNLTFSVNDTSDKNNQTNFSLSVNYIDPATFGVWDYQCNATGYCHEDEFHTRRLDFNWTIGNPLEISTYRYALGNAQYPTCSPSQDLYYGHYIEFTNITDTTDTVPFNITLTNFTIDPMGVYYLAVYGIDDQGNNETQVYTSNGIVFTDLTPPRCVGGDASCIYDNGPWAGNFLDLENAFLDAYWEFEDNETGVFTYTYAIGPVPYPITGFDEVVPATVTSNSNLTLYNLNLTHGQTYYWSVKAKNAQGLESDWQNSTGVTIDNEDPYGGRINHSTCNYDSNNLTIDLFIGYDDLSNVSYAEIYQRQAPIQNGDCDESQYGEDFLIATKTVSDVHHEMNLTDGYCYKFKYRVYDRAGNYRDYVHTDDCEYVKIDTSRPSTVSVYDVNYGEDGTTNPTGYYTNVGDRLFANWTAATDAESGISAYEYIITRKAPITGDYDQVLTPLLSVPSTTRSILQTGLLLEDSQWYYINVRAKNGAGTASVFSSSDGIYYVDNNAPVTRVYAFDNDNNLSNGYNDTVNDSQTVVTIAANEIIQCLWSIYDIDYDEDHASGTCTREFAEQVTNESINITLVNTSTTPWTIYNITTNVTHYNVTPISVCNITNLAQGTYTRYIVCKDERGNEQLKEYNHNLQFTIDWPEDPTISNITITPDPAYTNDTLNCTATYHDADGNGTADDTITNKYWNVYLNGIYQTSYTTNSPTITWDLSQTGNGGRGDNITCEFIIQDDTSRQTIRNATITISNSQPSTFALTAPDGEYIFNSTTFTWNTPSDLDNDSMTYLMWITNETSNATFFNSSLSIFNYTTTNTTQNLSFSFNEDTFYWFVTACDNSSSVNNCTNSTNVLSFITDQTGPNVNITSPENNQTTGGIINIEVLVNDSGIGTIDRVEYRILNYSNYSITHKQGNLTPGAGITYSLLLTNLTGIPEGNLTLNVTAYDSLNNSGSDLINFTLNNSAATAVILDPTYGANFFNQSFLVNMTGSSLINFTASIYNESGTLMWQNVTTYDALQSQIYFNETINISTLHEGVFTLNFTVNSYSNQHSDSIQFYIDLTPPHYSGASHSPSPAYDDTAITLYINWSNPFITDIGLNKYELEYVNITYNASGIWNTSTVYSATDQFSRTIPAAELDNGETIRWFATAKDFSGNTNTTEQYTVTIQNRPPIFSGNTPDTIVAGDVLSSDLGSVVYSALNTTTNTYDIYYYNINTNTTTTIADMANDLYWPRVYQNYVVYYDFNESDVYLYYLSNGTTVQISSQGSMPEIYNNLILFYGLANLETYNISSSNTSAIVDLTDQHTEGYSIYDDLVTYAPKNTSDTSATYNVYLYDISNNSTLVIANTSLNEAEPNIYDNYLSYYAYNTYIAELHFYNISSGQDTTIRTSQYGLNYPVLENGLIVWRETDANNNYTNYYYNITSGVYTQLTQTGQGKRPRGFDGQYFLLEGSLLLHDIENALIAVEIPEDANYTFNLTNLFTESDDDNLTYHSLHLPRGTILYDSFNSTNATEFYQGDLDFEEDEYNIVNNTAYTTGLFGNGILMEGTTTNLVTNPSFETGTSDPTGWTKVGTPKYDTANSATAKVQNDSVNVSNTHYYTQTVAVTGGETYTLSEYLKATTGNVNALLQIIWYTAGDAYISTNYRPNCIAISGEECPLITDTNNYVRRSVTVTAPATASKAKIILTTSSATYVKVDAVQLEQKSYATTYTDSTRTAMSLSYPVPDDYNKNQGTIQFWLKPGWNSSSSGSNYLFDTNSSSEYVRLSRTNSQLTATLTDSLWSYPLTGDISAISNSDYNLITLTWGADNITLYLNNESIATSANTVAPELSTIFLGSNKELTSHAGAIYDDFAMFNYAKSSSLIADDYSRKTTLQQLSANTSLTIDVNRTTGILTISSPPEYIGTERAIFAASDGNVLVPTDTVSFTYYFVNDAPTNNLSTFGLLNITEDSYNDTINLSNYASDNENATSLLTWSCVANETDITATANNSTKILNISSSNNFTGLATVTCTVYDLGGESASDTLTVNITPVNDAPVTNISALSTVTILEDTYNDTINLSHYAYDVDNTLTELNWTCLSNETNLNATANNLTKILNITAFNNWYGSAQVNCTVFDPAGANDYETFLVTVTSVNDAPVNTINTLGIITLPEDLYNDTINLSDYVSDIESADITLNWSCSTNNTNVTATPSNSTKFLNVTASNNFFGLVNVTCTVLDPNGGNDTESVLANVTPVNDAPTLDLSALNLMELLENSTNMTINLSDYASDIESIDANLNWSCSTNDTNLTATAYNTTKLLNLTANINFSSIVNVTCTVFDELAASATDSFLVEVIPLNDTTPPEVYINSPTLNQITNTSPFLVNITTDEPANCSLYDNVTMQIYNMNSINNLTHLLNITRTANDETHFINITCTDHSGNYNNASNSTTFRMMSHYILINSLSATPSNIADTYNSTINTSLTTAYNVSHVYASVISPNTTQYNLTLNIPDLKNLTVTNTYTAGIFTNTDQFGQYNLTLHVNDTQGNIASDNITFTVYDAVVQTVNLV